MKEKLLTVEEAAKAKGVSASAIRKAIAQNRLPATRMLGRIALIEAEVLRYEPQSYAGRPGAKGRGGRPCGTPQSAETKARIAVSQAERWAERKKERAIAQSQAVSV